jgi:hypothetical protein
VGISAKVVPARDKLPNQQIHFVEHFVAHLFDGRRLYADEVDD